MRFSPTWLSMIGQSLPPCVTVSQLYRTRNPRRWNYAGSSLIYLLSKPSRASRNLCSCELLDQMAIKTNGFIDGIFPEELRRVLQSLAMEWGDVVEDMKALQVIPMKGAMTNEVYQVNWPTKGGGEGINRKLLIRIYGEGVDLFFNRDDEVRTFECMSNHGQGPRLLGRFPEGRVEEFIHARTLSAADLRDPEISALIAAKMREFHNLEMPGSKTVSVWNKMRDLLGEAKSLCTVRDAKEFRLDVFEDEINMLEKEISKGRHETGFCHNDLQYGNVMIDEETKAITLIDYEYASYNHIAYDLANHFCEMAANYHSDTPHILDFDKYPGHEERCRFVRAYLSSSGEKPTEAKSSPLDPVVTFAFHVICLQRYVNQIDFDYLEYARQRLQQYWKIKPMLLLGSSGVVVNSCDSNGYAGVGTREGA
ncbi:unnamed protein product [Linum tenue]|uniref:Choline kinase 2 n=1 Tax=Linum tenue TaxID=586396 RepID=A0AAV0RHF4_9ROSI|nr:unnamed protein product [Linum tenue]